MSTDYRKYILSTGTHYISNSGSDENGAYHGGKAGDPAEEWPEWSQPIGAHDAYAAGDKVSHNSKHWVSNVNANVWEPGVYGWDEQE